MRNNDGICGIQFIGSLSFKHYTLQDIYLPESTSQNIHTGLDCISECWVSYKEHELLTLREQLSSTLVFWWGPCCSSFQSFVLPYYLSNIKYVFYRNTPILQIDTTYVIQNVVSHTYVIQDVL